VTENRLFLLNLSKIQRLVFY